MAEKNLNFDIVTERKHTNSLKYDLASRLGKPEGLLPMWVADMDFKVSSYIQEALESQVMHGIYGYSEVGEEYFHAVKDWMMTRHNWQVERRWMVKTPGVVFALAMAVKAYTEEGDGILIQQPVYYPFRNVIEENGRRTVNSPLLLDENGCYRMNVQDLEEKIQKEKVKLLFLCNPHNPVGRVWSREELINLGDICYRHHVIIVSDEIHSDLIFKGTHYVLADLKKEYRDITVTCTSPSKTFNIAGLQVSNIFIANAKLRKAFRQEINRTGVSGNNGVGLTACQAAYRYGEEWYQAMLSYVRANILFVKEYVSEQIPQIKVIETEGTYLVWLDCRALCLNDDQLEELIVKKAGLWLDSGTMFGEEGSGFQRMNVACPRSVLEKALEQLKHAVLMR